MRSLIVGGTHGLGKEIAIESHERGLEPIVTGRTAPEDLIMRGIRCEQMDVTDSESVARCIRQFEVQLSLGFTYLFYLPGVHLQGSFVEQSAKETRHALDVTIGGLMSVTRHFHRMKKKPYHLIVVTSTTSWKIRPDEAVYGAAKAAQAQFARNFHQELAKDLPGSQTLIVHPGGMRTPFWEKAGTNTEKFMDPAEVAKIIWNEIRLQASGEMPSLHELHIIRQKDGTPLLERGAKAPA